MLIRLIILIVFSGTLYVGYRLVIAWQKFKVMQQKDLDPLLANVDLAIPTLIYFTTPMCAVCKSTQRPALARLQKQCTVNLLEVNAMEDPDTAQRWGVLSVPTIFVLDFHGNPAKVNNGVSDEFKLSAQIQSLGTVKK